MSDALQTPNGTVPNSTPPLGADASAGVESPAGGEPTSDLEAGTTEAGTELPPGSEAPLPPTLVTLKLSNGREVQVPIEHAIQVASQAQEIGEEGWRAVQMLQQLQQAAQGDDPTALFEHLGLDPNSAMEKLIARLQRQTQEEIEEQTLSPEARELRQLKREKAEREAAEKKREAEAQKQREEVETAEAKKYMLKTIQEAIAQAGFEPSELAVRRIAAVWYELGKRGITDVPPSILAERARDEIEREHVAVMQKMDAKALYQKLGRKAFEGLLKVHLDELKLRPKDPPPPPKEVSDRQQPKETMNTQDFHTWLRTHRTR